MENTDITETGILSYRDLQDINDAEQFGEDNPPSYGAQKLGWFNAAKKYNREASPVYYKGYDELPSNFGESKYDERVPLWALEDEEALNDWRGKSQSGALQITNGIAKGAVLAGTTFLDGTIGLIYGIGQSIADGRISGLWDNEVSNALQKINEEMEKVLPNYRTAEEQNRRWYQNLGTANFWGDSFLKNMGFTVGAFYSGSAWNGAFKAIGVLKNGIAAQAVGSLLSAVNEGRIEANNGQKEFLELENKKIDDAYRKRCEEIVNAPLSDRDKEFLLAQARQGRDDMFADAKSRAHVMGLTTLLGNTALLTAGNLIQFGKLYSRGFDTAKDLNKKVKFWDKLGLAAQQEASGVELQNGRAIANEVSRVRAIGRGLLNPAVEGHEEMAQKVIQTYAGLRVSNDSPDSYYKALTDPKTRDEVLRTNSALAKSIADTWGNGDNWEEFAIGALTGALGMPTFGKVNNSSASTYLGKGRTIGLSGGIVGEYRSAMEKNKQAVEAADVMNKYMQKLADKENYFVQSKSFTDAMDGFSAENNRFEWNNYKDNDDFAAIAMFARTGHLDDLRDMINQDFENISDEELQNIAVNTSSDITTNPDGTVATTDENGKVITGTWRNVDGTLMSSTEEGRAKMRESLSQKRDDILKGIDEYEKSITRVRAIANGALDESQIEELAWLNWKGERFKDRYLSIKSENEEFLKAIQEGFDNTFRRVERAQEIWEELSRHEGESIKEWNERLRGKDKRGRALKDELRQLSNTVLGGIDVSDEAQAKLFNNLETVREFLGYIQNINDPVRLGDFLDANKSLLDILQNDAIMSIIARNVGNINTDTYNKGISELQDIAKIGSAAKSFRERYEEFVKNPLSQQQHRAKIDEEQAKDKAAEDTLQATEAVKDMSVQDLRREAAQGNINLEEISNNKDMEDLANKAEEAMAIDKKINEIESILADNPDIDEQTKTDALTLLHKAGDIDVAESAEEIEQFGREVYQDTRNLSIDNMPDMSPEELEKEMNQRRDKAIEALVNASEEARSKTQEIKDKPNNLQQSVEESKNAKPSEEVGHDSTPTTPSTQEQKAAQQAKEQQDISVKEYVNNLMTSHPNLSALPEGMIAPVVNNLTALLSWVKKHNDSSIRHLLEDFIKPKSKAYQNLYNILGNDIDSIITEFYNASKSTKTEKVQETSEPRVLTTNTDPSNLTTQSEASKEYANRKAAEEADLPPKFATDKYRYWRRNTPSYIIDSTTKLPIRWEPSSQRDKAVVAYHEKHGTFDRLDRGEVQEGDEVFYIIDEALNEDAGEIVILMAKRRVSDSNVSYDIIGDVSSKASQNINEYQWLKEFIDRVENEYKEFNDSKKTGLFVSKQTNHVLKLMSGYVLYTSNTENRRTLNNVFKDKKFNLGVATMDGSLSSSVRIKPDGSSMDKISDLESLIIKPISPNIKKGQPFLLLETGNKKRRGYVAVPFSMPTISSEHTSKGLYQSIQRIIEAIAESKGNKAKIAKLKDRLLQFVNIPNIYFAFDQQGNLTKVIRYIDDNRKVSFNIEPNATTEEIIQSIMSSFNGLSYRVDRSLFNSTYNGQSYNSMVGELAEVNLPENFTHTVGNWFVTNILDNNGKEIKAQAPKSTGNSIVKQQVTNDIKKDVQKPIQTQPVNNTQQVSQQGETDQVVLESMSQDEYAEWLKQNGYPAGTNKGDVYDMLTARRKYRGKNFTKRLDYVKNNTQKVAELTKFLQELDAKFLDDTIVIEGVTASSKGTGWNHFIINNDTDKSNSETNKGYVTLSQEGVLSLSESDIIDFLRKVQESGFNGQVKFPEIGSRMLLAFDNFVIHGRTQEDVDKAMKIAEELFKDKIEGLQTGVDRNGTSHTDNLANEVIAAVENKEKTTTTSTQQNTTDYSIEDALQELEDVTQQVSDQNRIASNDELQKQAEDRKLFSKYPVENVWKAMSNEEKQALLNIPDTALGNVAQFLSVFAFDARNNSFKQNVFKGKTLLEYLKEQSGRRDNTVRRLRTVDKNKETSNIEKERELIASCLPQLSKKEVIRLHDGYIKISKTSSPEYAWGEFRDGIITISNIASRGTVYHEAFHYVFNSLLTDDEIISMYNAAKEIYGDKSLVELEENMAEDFRRYMQFQEELQAAEKTGNTEEWERIKREMKSLLNKLEGKTSILNTIFSNIYNKKYADRIVNYRNAAIIKEMQNIKEEAITNGTFMKAPNGKPTNLTEKQWLQVRTKAFKEWFGDWTKITFDKDGKVLTIPDDCSKIVDKNGEPLIVYHITDVDFDTVDFDKIKGNVFFHAGSENAAIERGRRFGDKKVYKKVVFLNIKNPIEITDEQQDDNNLFLRFLKDNNIIDDKLFNTLRNSYDRNTVIKSIRDILNNRGIDGIKYINDIEDKGSTSYGAINPNQVKSATDNIGTFSPENDGIRHRLIGIETVEQYDKELQEVTNEFNKKSKSLTEWFNKIKQNYIKALQTINKNNKLTFLEQDYYYIDTGRIVDERTKNSYLGDRNMTDFGKVIAYNNHWTILIPIANSDAELMNIIADKNIVFEQQVQKVEALAETIEHIKNAKSNATSMLNEAYARVLKEYKDARLMYDNLDDYGKEIIDSMGYTQETWDNLVTSDEKEDMEICRL